MTTRKLLLTVTIVACGFVGLYATYSPAIVANKTDAAVCCAAGSDASCCNGESETAVK